MFYLLIVILVILLLALFYQLLIKPLRYWDDKQIPYVKPLPIVGNFLKNFIYLQSFGENLLSIYNSRRNEKYYGMFLFSTPFLVVQDLELIKSITVKNFDHFTDHTDFIFQDFDPLFVRNVFSLNGKEWHGMRSTLSPAFTGSKMRVMFPLIMESCQQFVDFLKKELQNSKKGYIDLEFKNIYSRLAIDVVANTAFGLRVNSLQEKNNTFFKMVSDVASISTWKIALSTAFPRLMKFFNLSPQAIHPLNYFRNLVKDTIQHRERENIYRPDMLQLLIEARKGTLKYDDKLDVEEKINDAEFLKNSEKLEKITDEDMAAQAFVFILGGVDTTSDLLTFVTYELAVNPHVQDRLHLEIRETLNSNNGKINYEILQKMKYLDMVISETLRVWPPAAFLERICVKPYILNVNDKEIPLDRGTRILFPALGLHHDPKYYDQPKVFNPERFDDENKVNIKPFTYVPFGMGPRICIGQRLALLEAKLVLYHLIKDFEVFVTEKTTIPPVLATACLQLRFKYGCNLGLRMRSQNEE